LLHPSTELRFINREIGFGVFATQLIPRGTLTWVCDQLDQVVGPERVTALPPRYRRLLDTYTFRDDAGQHLLCWDLARFMNHSCSPCCLGPDSSFEVAVRDIHPGEELTDDYASLHLQDHESFACRCGLAECRGWVGPEDADRHAPEWERQVIESLQLATDVPQALAPILLESVEQRRISAGVLPLLRPLLEQLLLTSMARAPRRAAAGS
jgi:hypothetical protein